MSKQQIIGIVIGLTLIGTLFLGLGWTWVLTVCAFFLGLGMMMYLALNSKDYYKVPTKFQERVGYFGAIITLASMLSIVVHVLWWVFHG